MRAARLEVLALVSLVVAPAHASGLALPPAPVRIFVSDVGAFDAALAGGFRAALEGAPSDEDTVAAAWRTTQVGAKLESQWQSFSADLSISWADVLLLHPTSMGLAMTDVGSLEGVLVVETSLADLPWPLPEGREASHGGQSYRIVAAGAGDGSGNPDRRMGLAWARMDGALLLATSERILRLTIDEALAGRRSVPTLDGLVSIELDMDALDENFYFRREYLFEHGHVGGMVRAALRREGDALVEVREGRGPLGPPAPRFDPPAGAVAWGWETSAPLWPALWRGLLDPSPAPDERPVVSIGPLPAARQKDVDRYLVDFGRYESVTSGGHEEADLATWRELLGTVEVPGWGYAVLADGTRVLVVPWPASEAPAFERAVSATLSRRSGGVRRRVSRGVVELLVGPELPGLALRITDGFIWIATDAGALREVAAPRVEPRLVAWGELDLDAVRGLAPRWAAAEDAAYGGEGRPLTDRLLGVLGWMTDKHWLAVERVRTDSGWSETVTFR